MDMDMEQPTIPLGASSLPAIGFGTFEIAEADVEAAVSAALQLGYRHIDTAEGYNNESGVGRALASHSSRFPDEPVFLTTKLCIRRQHHSPPAGRPSLLSATRRKRAQQQQQQQLSERVLSRSSGLIGVLER